MGEGGRGAGAAVVCKKKKSYFTSIHCRSLFHSIPSSGSKTFFKPFFWLFIIFSPSKKIYAEVYMVRVFFRVIQDVALACICSIYISIYIYLFPQTDIVVTCTREKNNSGLYNSRKN